MKSPNDWIDSLMGPISKYLKASEHNRLYEAVLTIGEQRGEKLINGLVSAFERMVNSEYRQTESVIHTAQKWLTFDQSK